MRCRAQHSSFALGPPFPRTNETPSQAAPPAHRRKLLASLQLERLWFADELQQHQQQHVFCSLGLSLPGAVAERLHTTLEQLAQAALALWGAIVRAVLSVVHREQRQQAAQREQQQQQQAASTPTTRKHRVWWWRRRQQPRAQASSAAAAQQCQQQQQGSTATMTTQGSGGMAAAAVGWARVPAQAARVAALVPAPVREGWAHTVRKSGCAQWGGAGTGVHGALVRQGATVVGRRHVWQSRGHGRDGAQHRRRLGASARRRG